MGVVQIGPAVPDDVQLFMGTLSTVHHPLVFGMWLFDPPETYAQAVCPRGPCYGAVVGIQHVVA